MVCVWGGGGGGGGARKDNNDPQPYPSDADCSSLRENLSFVTTRLTYVFISNDATGLLKIAFRVVKRNGLQVWVWRRA